jgi:ABC-type lipoprotein export system ATPase subunit
MTALIELRGVGLTVDAPAPTSILRQVDLTIRSGTSVAIVGPSGAGKTTLASIIGALQAPTEGSYQFRGEEIVGRSSQQLAAFRANHLGFVFQQSHLIDERTAHANVALGITDDTVPKRERDARSHDALEHVGLGPIADRRAGNLSGGERHRVAIARALVKSPTIVIADEPTAALDQATGQEILDLLSNVTQRGATLIVVSHDQRAAAGADQVVTILDGAIHE